MSGTSAGAKKGWVSRVRGTKRIGSKRDQAQALAKLTGRNKSKMTQKDINVAWGIKFK